MNRAPLLSAIVGLSLSATTLQASRAATVVPLDPGGLPLPTTTAAASLSPLAPAAGVPLVPASATDGTWYPVPAIPVPTIGTRMEHTIVFDPVRQRFLAFGGHPRFLPGLFNDVWERPVGGTGDWTLLAVTGTPPAPRRGHSAVYDPVGDRMIVYAGYGGGYRSDVWELTLGGVPHWNQLLPTGTAPGARFAHTAVFDASRDRMVVFGGFVNASDSTQTWFLDCTTSPPAWQPADVPGTPPAARGQYAAVYDPVRDRMVVFGGASPSNTNNLFGDLWTLSFSPSLTWTQQAASNPFGKRSLAGCAYDPAHDRMIVTCGHASPGQFNDVVFLDLGTLGWTAGLPATTPTAREAAGFAFDPATQTGLLQGGYGNLQPEAYTDTWALTFTPAATWTNVVPNANPWLPGALRYGSAGFYDALRNRFVATCGGYDAGNLNVLNDVLALQIGVDSSWISIAPPPPAGFRRVAHSATYDPVRDRLLVFGGFNNGAFLNDLWEVRFTPSVTVSALSPTGTPPTTRDYQSAIYDPVRDRVVVFGGNQAGTPLNDVKTLMNLSGTPVWSGIPIVGTPPSPRWLAGAIYDPYGDRVLVFGGFDGAGSLNDLWSLSLAGGIGTWTQLSPAGPAPSVRFSPTMVLDTNRQRALVYGGRDQGGDTETSDVWQLALGGQPLAWSPLAPAGTLPPGRYVQLGLYDPIHDRLLVSGGASHTAGTLSDVWRLQFGDVATAAAIALVSSIATAGDVTLSWDVSGAVSGVATLERRDGGAAWRAIDHAGVDGRSSLTFHDHDVVAGTRYGYRLTVAEREGTTTSSEVWIDVPVGPAFSLAGFSPNPATREARVAFSLAERAPATIEVVDVGGRRVASRTIDSPTPGAQSIAIAPRGGLSPGLYFVKLTQGARTTTVRGTIVR